jgi:hypothetical protein
LDSDAGAASGGEAQPFPQPTQNTRIVDISPDRAELLSLTFFGRSNDLPLWLTPIVGGPPRRVGNIVADDAIFSNDGRRIFFNRPDGIYSCERDGTGVKRLVALPGRSEDLQWSKRWAAIALHGGGSGHQRVLNLGGIGGRKESAQGQSQFAPARINLLWTLVQRRPLLFLHLHAQ